MKDVKFTEEVWKDIPDFEGIYQVSNFGRVKSLERLTKNKQGTCLRKEKLLTLNISNKGYAKVKLYNTNKNIKKTIFVHKLVGVCFLDNLNQYKEINHIDGDKLNNKMDNLEWCSRSHNVKETYRLNLKKEETYKGEGNATSKLKEQDVLLIRKLHKQGMSNKELAIKFNVVSGTIGFIVNNQTWKHI